MELSIFSMFVTVMHIQQTRVICSWTLWHDIVTDCWKCVF